jgi:transcriptional regulator with XRE-family HTH domain
MKVKPIYAATLIKRARINRRLSQNDVSVEVGFSKSTQGQFISNLERGLCNIPPTKIKKLCTTLNIELNDLKLAMLRDYEIALDNEIAKHSVNSTILN